jgi:uncharacterized protein YraI
VFGRKNAIGSMEKEIVEIGKGKLMETTTRRSFLKRAAGAGAVAAAVGIGLKLDGSVSAQESSHYRTTSALKLRTGPGPRRRVILIMPQNAVVTYAGQSKYGYRKVSYQGTVGWAHADYLEVSNGGSTDVPVPVGSMQTTDSVNFRWEPSSSSKVIQVLKPGTVVEVFDYFANGYRMVGYANIAGWVHMDYLAEVEGPLGGYVRTTSALNLRAEPSTSSKVLAVMPKNARAFRGDVIANDFLGVTYNGIFGWAHTDYLVTE